LVVSVDYFFPEQVGNGGTSNDSDAKTAGEMTASQMRQAKVDQVPDNNGATEFPPRARSLSPVVHPDARPMIELQGGVAWSRLTAFGESDAEFLEITYIP